MGQSALQRGVARRSEQSGDDRPPEEEQGDDRDRLALVEVEEADDEQRDDGLQQRDREDEVVCREGVHWSSAFQETPTPPYTLTDS